jgi:hypothetical protein
MYNILLGEVFLERTFYYLTKIGGGSERLCRTVF